MYSPENCAQYFIITDKGKNLKNLCVCIMESLCCTPEMNTTWYINYASKKEDAATVSISNNPPPPPEQAQKKGLERPQ